jgi:hypothetical protein
MMFLCGLTVAHFWQCRAQLIRLFARSGSRCEYRAGEHRRGARRTFPNWFLTRTFCGAKLGQGISFRRSPAYSRAPRSTQDAALQVGVSKRELPQPRSFAFTRGGLPVIIPNELGAVRTSDADQLSRTPV